MLWFFEDKLKAKFAKFLSTVKVMLVCFCVVYGQGRLHVSSFCLTTLCPRFVRRCLGICLIFSIVSLNRSRSCSPNSSTNLEILSSGWPLKLSSSSSNSVRNESVSACQPRPLQNSVEATLLSKSRSLKLQIDLCLANTVIGEQGDHEIT